MKKLIAAVLVMLVIGYLADRLVRIENQRYALYVNQCKYDPANPAVRWDCLERVLAIMRLSA